MTLQGTEGGRVRLIAARRLAAVVGCAVFLAVSACKDAPTESIGADVPKKFKLQLVEGQSVPYRMYFFRLGGAEMIDSAILKPEVGDSAKLTTNGKLRMADVRIFRGVDRLGAFAETHRDSSTVLIERKGDLLLITRSYQYPGKIRVDTGRFDSGKMVVTVHEWEWNEFPPDVPWVLQFIYLY